MKHSIDESVELLKAGILKKIGSAEDHSKYVTYDEDSKKFIVHGCIPESKEFDDIVPAFKFMVGDTDE